MSETPLKKRRNTILVTGPQNTKMIHGENEGIQENQDSLQNIAIVRQRLQNELAVVNTASGIEILMQIVMDELEIVRHRLRENGERMRWFIRNHLFGNQIKAILIRIFSKSVSSRNMIEYKNEKNEILNELMGDDENEFKLPRFTLNDIEEVLLTDDLEDGVIQRRSERWSRLPMRQKPLIDDDDSFCEFRRMNFPMPMHFEEDEDEDRSSMPSTRTQLTTEDQMAAIQNQLAMLSKQLASLQKTSTDRGTSSRASSRKGGRRIEKKASIDISETSSSSEVSEDEGKGPSVCSPSLSLKRKPAIVAPMAPIALAPPPPPPPPPPMALFARSAPKLEESTPLKVAAKKPAPNSLPPAETITSNRPYLTDIANGRSLLKKTARQSGSPSSKVRHQKRAVSSFEAALQNRFRGFHGDNSYSEQEENGDEDVNATWDE